MSVCLVRAQNHYKFIRCGCALVYEVFMHSNGKIWNIQFVQKLDYEFSIYYEVLKGIFICIYERVRCHQNC